jgi:hypothetical protein
MEDRDYYSFQTDKVSRLAEEDDNDEDDDDEDDTEEEDPRVQTL